MIDAVVAPVDQTRFAPVAVSTELPHPLAALTVGAAGAEGSETLTATGADAQPVLKTKLYVPAANPVTVYGRVTPLAEPVADPVQVRFPVPVPVSWTLPVAVPQDAGLTTVPAAIDGTARGAAVTVEGELVHPPTVCVTV